jgi:hypothetical protein
MTPLVAQADYDDVEGVVSQYSSSYFLIVQ